MIDEDENDGPKWRMRNEDVEREHDAESPHRCLARAFLIEGSTTDIPQHRT
jgi:hypothetical protein